MGMQTTRGPERIYPTDTNVILKYGPSADSFYINEVDARKEILSQQTIISTRRVRVLWRMWKRYYIKRHWLLIGLYITASSLARHYLNTCFTRALHKNMHRAII